MTTEQHIIDEGQAIKTIQHSIFVTKSNIAGRGVFTSKSFKKGEEIEIAPYLVVQKNNIQGLITKYYFGTSNPDYVIIILGYGSMYNHSKSNNVTYYYTGDEQYIRFVALRDISAGEELTINYGSAADFSK